MPVSPKIIYSRRKEARRTDVLTSHRHCVPEATGRVRATARGAPLFGWKLCPTPNAPAEAPT